MNHSRMMADVVAAWSRPRTVTGFGRVLTRSVAGFGPDPGGGAGSASPVPWVDGHALYPICGGRVDLPPGPPMAQGWPTKIISILKWIRTSRLSMKSSLSFLATITPVHSKGYGEHV
jgi:hypothetical protein